MVILRFASSCFPFQDGVVISADDAGDTGVGQQFADGQTVTHVLVDGPTSTRRVLAP